MRQFLVLLSATLLTALSVSLLGTSPVNAASDWDNFEPVEELLMTTNFSNQTHEDISLIWGSIFENTCSAVIDFNRPYAVIQEKSTSNQIDYEYRFYVYQAPQLEQFHQLEWDLGPSNLPRIQGVVAQQWLLHYNYSTNEYGCIYAEPANLRTFWIEAIPAYTSDYNIFLSTYEPNYPLDYEGEPIPDTRNPPTSPDTTFGLSPYFNYQIDDLSLTLTSLTQSSLLDEYFIDECTFLVQTTLGDTEYEEYPINCQSPLPVFHTFTEYGQYDVKLKYYSTENDKTYETIQVVIIDGTTYSGTAGGQTQGNTIIDMLQQFALPNYGLQQALVAPIQFVGNLPSLGGVCEPITLPLPAYIDSNENIELPCLTPIYQTYAPNFLTLWQVSLTALVSYAIVNKVFAKLRETYNPHKNSIEPTNL